MATAPYRYSPFGFEEAVCPGSRAFVLGPSSVLSPRVRLGCRTLDLGPGTDSDEAPRTKDCATPQPKAPLGGDVDGNRLAEPRHRGVLVVANLQRQLVLARRQLHVDLVLSVAEVDPWRRLRDDCPRRQAIGVDRDMVVPHARP